MTVCPAPVMGRCRAADWIGAGAANAGCPIQKSLTGTAETARSTLRPAGGVGRVPRRECGCKLEFPTLLHDQESSLTKPPSKPRASRGTLHYTHTVMLSGDHRPENGDRRFPATPKDAALVRLLVEHMGCTQARAAQMADLNPNTVGRLLRRPRRLGDPRQGALL